MYKFGDLTSDEQKDNMGTSGREIQKIEKLLYTAKESNNGEINYYSVRSLK